jgi:hypothetical protein
MARMGELAEGRGRVVRTLTPRVGAQAARHYLAALTASLVFVALVPTWVILIIVGARLGHPVVTALGFAALVAMFWAFAVAVVGFRRYTRTAEAVLGVPVGWDDPPAQEGKYVAWCRAKGIEPFTAEAESRPESP